jgi:hypothetical protein
MYHHRLEEKKFLLETTALTDEIHQLQNRFRLLGRDIKGNLQDKNDDPEEEEEEEEQEFDHQQLSEESENNRMYHALYNKHKYTSANSTSKKKPLLIEV